MHPPLPHTILEQKLWLTGNRCLYWEQQQLLVVADLHFGKSGHFRKEGIGIPQTVFKEDLQRLLAEIQFFQPRELLVVGDFFHSHLNNEVRMFEKWRSDIAHLPIRLVNGNHDMLPQSWYTANAIQLHATSYQLERFCFIHEYDARQHTNDELYYFSGHLHPAIYIDGKARQSLRFPCFYFSKGHAVLPAFGKFTGTYLVKPTKKDTVFAIVNQQLLPIAL